jgi:hypothetical protein
MPRHPATHRLPRRPIALQLAFAAVLTCGQLTVLHAGTEIDRSTNDQIISEKADAVFADLWSIPKLYQDPANPFIEEFDIVGRYQQDYFNVTSNRGSNSFLEIRRFRLGEDAFLLDGHLELMSEVDTALRTDKNPSIFYNRFTNLYGKLWLSEAFNIRFGKFEPHFGYDREFSDTLQKFFERSFFDDQILGSTDYVPGVEVSGSFGHFGYMGMIYSTNVNKEFGHFNGGQAYQAEVSYDLSKAWHTDKALWVLDYLHADGKSPTTNVFTRSRDAAATYLDFTHQRFSLVAQLGYDHQVGKLGDIYDFHIMPGYKLTEKLEMVVRYQLGLGTEKNAIATLNRQQQTIGTFTGNNYNAVYMGLNYYLYGMKLRLMAGEEYAHLGGGTGPTAGYDGWTTWVGFRLNF